MSRENPNFFVGVLGEQDGSCFTCTGSLAWSSSVSPGTPHPGVFEEVFDLLVVNRNHFIAKKLGK